MIGHFKHFKKFHLKSTSVKNPYFDTLHASHVKKFQVLKNYPLEIPSKSVLGTYFLRMVCRLQNGAKHF